MSDLKKHAVKIAYHSTRGYNISTSHDDALKVARAVYWGLDDEHPSFFQDHTLDSITVDGQVFTLLDLFPKV